MHCHILCTFQTILLLLSRSGTDQKWLNQSSLLFTHVHTQMQKICYDFSEIIKKTISRQRVRIPLSLIIFFKGLLFHCQPRYNINRCMFSEEHLLCCKLAPWFHKKRSILRILSQSTPHWIRWPWPALGSPW